MALKYIAVAVVAVAITMFALQNSAPASVRFVVWQVDVPLATTILASVALGVVLVGVPLLVERWRLRSRLRSLESRLGEAEKQPGDASDRAPGPPTPWP
jgi:putative membrane protein